MSRMMTRFTPCEQKMSIDLLHTLIATAFLFVWLMVGGILCQNSRDDSFYGHHSGPLD